METFYYGPESPDFSSAPRHHSLLPIIFEPKDDESNGSHGISPATSHDTMKEVRGAVPQHPIPSMQNAFAESMQEASENSTPTDKTKHSAAVRRQILLDQELSEDTHATRWRQKPGQQYHQLWKLMSQISFGIYLLLNGIAKDDGQVMNILQGHVDEVDEFLEMTLEDFDLAQEDIDERLKFLKLPLENIAIFDAMLEDRAFRLQIVNGNERIEHVIQRTAAAMKDSLQDVREGLNACREFTIYLAEEQDRASWRYDRQDMEKVYEAMKGNVEGWHKAYVSLQTKGNHLGVALVQLGSIVAEMDRRAGDISRKTRFHSPHSSITSPPSSPPPRSREMRKSMLKTLPSNPNMITPAIRSTLPAFGMVQDRERSPEPESRTSSSPEPTVESMSSLAPEPEYFLAPRTYTPVPSPQTAQELIQEPTPPPEIKQRSSLRKRFTLKRNSNSEPIQKTQQDLKPTLRFDEERSPSHKRIHSFSDAPELRENASSNLDPSRKQASIVRNPVELDASMNTPSSRGLDSAYCSDLDKPFSPPIQQYSAMKSGHRSPHLETPPALTTDFPIPSPRSDQQFFRPVQASPNSPLQRPWTAAPFHHNHIRENSNLSNMSAGSGGSIPPASKSRLQFSHTHTPSQSGLRDQYNAAREKERGQMQSRMGMSMMSEMTMKTENGKNVKKKRSAFGWLKKAFALSDEEKAAFEERRRQIDQADQYNQRPQQRWIDGKRIR